MDYLSKRIKSRQQTLTVIFLILACVFLSSCVTKKEKEYRVGIVSGAETFANITDGFKAKMTELGYVEGENIVYDFHRLNANPAGEKRVVKKFVQDKVDLILAFPTDPAVVAKAGIQGTNIPLVFAHAGTEGNNLIESVRRPGINITGVRAAAVENTIKRFELLHEMVPQAKRILICYDPAYPNNPPTLKLLRSLAPSLGITLVEDFVRNFEELQPTLEKRIARDDGQIDAILIMPDLFNFSPNGFRIFLEFANEHKLPLAGGAPFMADMGAMFSYFPDNVEVGMMAAALADKIFKGIPAGTIPAVSPEHHLRINYKIIQRLGLEINEGLLSRADEIIR